MAAPHVVMVRCGITLAHGTTGRATDALGVSPLALSLLAAYTVVVVGVRAARRPAPATAGPQPRRAKGRIPPMWLSRSVGVGILTAAVVTSRVGGFTSEEARLWPLVVSGAVWPMLVLLSAALRDVWPRVDPWDSLARLIAPSGQPPPPRGDVRWAVPMAFSVAWFLYAWPAARHPRALSAGLLAYTAVMLTGCVIAGRHWLRRAEAVGVFLSWVARMRHRGLMGWVPERGAAPILGIFAAGALFGELRTSSWAGTIPLSATPLSTVLPIAIACAPVVALVLAGERWARQRGAAGAVLVGCVPTIAGLVVALSLTDNELLHAAHGALQLLGIRRGLPPPHFSGDVQVISQLVILVASAASGAAIAARRASDSRAGVPSTLVCAAFAAGATLLVAAA